MTILVQEKEDYNQRKMWKNYNRMTQMQVVSGEFVMELKIIHKKTRHRQKRDER